MGDHADYLFKAEYAKSSRASCKSCKGLITKDSLRLAVMVQSPFFDGKQPNWFHYKCFWSRAKVTQTSDIHGYDGLRWDDQEKIKEKMGGGGGAAGGSGEGPDPYKDFKTEYAKSNRSKCRGCDDTINKDDVRLSMKDYESERARLYGPQDLWHHVDCFVENREDINFGTDMQPVKIPGFKSLSKDDQEMLIEKLGKGSASLKRKKSSKSESSKKAKKETPEEKALREQSKLLWEIRDQLQKNVSNNALKVLLEYNGQDVVGSESKLLDRITDGMAFGALQRCPECKDGQFVPGATGYHCTGNLTEWTKCQNSTHKPDRKPFKVPKEFHDVDFLAKYKYVKREKAFSEAAAVRAAESSVVSSGDNGNKPLSGMKFVLGKTDGSKYDLTKKIVSLGGSVVSSMDKKVMALISTKAEVSKKSKLVKEAKKCDVHVVEEGLLEDVSKGGAALLIKTNAICDWGSDPLDRICEVPKSAPKKSAYRSAMEARNESMFTKSVPMKQRMKLKGGAAVDPDSGLEDSAHVLEQNGVIYNAVLGLVDISRGTNSYYKLQILEADGSSRCWLFRSWGRVGTTIGGNKVENCGNSRHAAIEQFEALYAEKTGNEWENRNNFTKVPNRFYPLDIDYGAEDDDVKLSLSGPTNSKLPTPVQDLVKMIFDVESMKKAMLEFEIDLKKMPLGKLSKKQIQSAYSVLTELNQLIETGGSPTMFLDASNRFYTLIPHDFGMKKPPMLDTVDVIKSKISMLDNLMDIEIAYNMMKSGDGGGDVDPLDMHYSKLKTDIKVLDKSTEEYDTLKTYISNTHASTHRHYDLELLEVFKVDREGEQKRYKPFKSLGNRKLLWHGSRVTNFAGILSQGLRIAPPEAPVTGYMFGKGVYFADMVSKSANYCSTSSANPVGLLLLCDVALGKVYELTGAKYITKLPKGMHSTKGCGRTHPDPSGDVTKDDVMIPTGVGVAAPIAHSSLLYNEYIVYDTAQINMKYLLKCKFNYKSLW